MQVFEMKYKKKSGDFFVNLFDLFPYLLNCSPRNLNFHVCKIVYRDKDMILNNKLPKTKYFQRIHTKLNAISDFP